MKFILTFCLSLASFAAFAGDFKCYSSKYPENMMHAFQDGYSLLSINGKSVTLQYYYVNTVAKETTLEYQAVYTIRGLKNGTGKLSKLHVADFKSSSTGPGLGDNIDTIYLEPALLRDSVSGRGIAGKYVFTGHTYGYDWNICYAK